jgi:uncharacterized small protein (DUF1192 family)
MSLAGAAVGLLGAAMSLAGAAVGLALPAPAAADEGARLYRWSDEQGAVRYTPDPSRIPRAQRAGAQPVEPGQPPPGDEATPVAPPASERSGASLGDSPGPPGSPEPAQPEETSPPAGESGVSDLDARIRELEASIARDQQLLQAMIASPAQGDGDSLAESPELREIARRLPALQAELRRLRAERAAQQQP